VEINSIRSSKTCRKRKNKNW